MKFKNPMLVVKDINNAKQFYHNVLGLRVISDLGENVTLTGGISLQTEKSYLGWIKKEISYQANNMELYFEEDDFDKFLSKLDNIKDINYVHSVMKHTWGQRVVRFYDPDGHIIEVGENIKLVCKRFLESGLSIEQTAQKMDVPILFVKHCQKAKE